MIHFDGNENLITMAIERLAHVRWQQVSLQSQPYIINFLSRSSVIEYHWELESISAPCDPSRPVIDEMTLMKHEAHAVQWRDMSTWNSNKLAN